MSNTNFTDFDSKTPNPEMAQVLDVTPEEVLQKKDEVKLIDVRRPDEYTGELGHVPGAELLTLDYLPQRIRELPTDRTIVFICRSGGRSARATAFALENGFKSVYNMKGGMLLWNEKSLAVEGRNGM